MAVQYFYPNDDLHFRIAVNNNYIPSSSAITWVESFPTGLYIDKGESSNNGWQYIDEGIPANDSDYIRVNNLNGAYFLSIAWSGSPLVRNNIYYQSKIRLTNSDYAGGGITILNSFLTSSGTQIHSNGGTISSNGVFTTYTYNGYISNISSDYVIFEFLISPNNGGFSAWHELTISAIEIMFSGDVEPAPFNGSKTLYMSGYEFPGYYEFHKEIPLFIDGEGNSGIKTASKDLYIYGIPYSEQSGVDVHIHGRDTYHNWCYVSGTTCSTCWQPTYISNNLDIQMDPSFASEFDDPSIINNLISESFKEALNFVAFSLSHNEVCPPSLGRQYLVTRTKTSGDYTVSTTVTGNTGNAGYDYDVDIDISYNSSGGVYFTDFLNKFNFNNLIDPDYISYFSGAVNLLKLNPIGPASDFVSSFLYETDSIHDAYLLISLYYRYIEFYFDSSYVIYGYYNDVYGDMTWDLHGVKVMENVIWAYTTPDFIDLTEENVFPNSFSIYYSGGSPIVKSKSFSLQSTEISGIKYWTVNSPDFLSSGSLVQGNDYSENCDERYCIEYYEYIDCYGMTISGDSFDLELTTEGSSKYGDISSDINSALSSAISQAFQQLENENLSYCEPLTCFNAYGFGNEIGDEVEVTTEISFGCENKIDIAIEYDFGPGMDFAPLLQAIDVNFMPDGLTANPSGARAAIQEMIDEALSVGAVITINNIGGGNYQFSRTYSKGVINGLFVYPFGPTPGYSFVSINIINSVSNWRLQLETSVEGPSLPSFENINIINSLIPVDSLLQETISFTWVAFDDEGGILTLPVALSDQSSNIGTANYSIPLVETSEGEWELDSNSDIRSTGLIRTTSQHIQIERPKERCVNIDDNCDPSYLFIEGYDPSFSGETPLLISGGYYYNSGIDLCIDGYYYTYTDLNLFEKVNSPIPFNSGNLPTRTNLYLEGYNSGSSNRSVNLYMPNQSEHGGVNLFLQPVIPRTYDDSINLWLNNPESGLFTNPMNLYIGLKANEFQSSLFSPRLFLYGVDFPEYHKSCELYVIGGGTENDEYLNLYFHTYTPPNSGYFNDNLNLYLSVKEPIFSSSNMNMYLCSDYQYSSQFPITVFFDPRQSGDFNLVLGNFDIGSDINSVNLALTSYLEESGIIPFYIRGGGSAGVNLFLQSTLGTEFQDNVDLSIFSSPISGLFGYADFYISGEAINQSNINLWIGGNPQIFDDTSYLNLFLKNNNLDGSISTIGGCDFIIWNGFESGSISTDLFLQGSEFILNEGKMNLYIGREYEGITESIPYYLAGPSGEFSSTSLYLEGLPNHRDSIPFYISGVVISGDFVRFYIRGF